MAPKQGMQHTHCGHGSMLLSCFICGNVQAVAGTGNLRSAAYCSSSAMTTFEASNQGDVAVVTLPLLLLEATAAVSAVSLYMSLPSRAPWRQASCGHHGGHARGTQQSPAWPCTPYAWPCLGERACAGEQCWAAGGTPSTSHAARSGAHRSASSSTAPQHTAHTHIRAVKCVKSPPQQQQLTDWDPSDGDAHANEARIASHICKIQRAKSHFRANSCTTDSTIKLRLTLYAPIFAGAATLLAPMLGKESVYRSRDVDTRSQPDPMPYLTGLRPVCKTVYDHLYFGFESQCTRVPAGAGCLPCRSNR